MSRQCRQRRPRPGLLPLSLACGALLAAGLSQVLPSAFVGVTRASPGRDAVAVGMRAEEDISPALRKANARMEKRRKLEEAEQRFMNQEMPAAPAQSESGGAEPVVLAFDSPEFAENTAQALDGEKFAGNTMQAQASNIPGVGPGREVIVSGLDVAGVSGNLIGRAEGSPRVFLMRADVKTSPLAIAWANSDTVPKAVGFYILATKANPPTEDEIESARQIATERMEMIIEGRLATMGGLPKRWLKPLLEAKGSFNWKRDVNQWTKNLR